MSEPAYYRIAKWSEFQHYRDRNPPWIKLHYSLLSSRTWVGMDDATRVLAVACMLIASRDEGKIPNDPEYIQRVAYLRRRPDLSPLLLCGFIVADASKALAGASICEQMQADARPETETENIYIQSDASKVLADGNTPVREKILVELPLADGSQFAVTETMAKPWPKAFPGVDIERELQAMLAWLIANPARGKTRRGALRFVTAWLDRAQNRARPAPAAAGPAYRNPSYLPTVDEIRAADERRRGQ